MWADSLSWLSFCRPGGRPVRTILEEMLKHNKARIHRNDNHLCHTVCNHCVSQLSVFNGSIWRWSLKVYVSVCLDVVLTVEIRQERGSARHRTFEIWNKAFLCVTTDDFYTFTELFCIIRSLDNINTCMCLKQ